MKIAVIGMGAIGGVWAAALARAGHEVWGVETSMETIAAVREHGVIVEDRAAGTTTATPINITDLPAETGPVDAVFVFVKHHQTRSAAASAVPLVDAKTTVCSLQNGWGNSQILVEFFSPEQVVMGVTYQSATVVSPGRVAHTAKRPSVIGPFLPDGPIERAEAIVTALSGSDLDIRVSTGIVTDVWKKLVFNCASLPTAALTRLRSAQLVVPGPLTDDVLDALVWEAVAVAQALGLPISFEERRNYVRRALGDGRQGKASMLQDIEAERTTEIGAVNGAVAREAARLGVPVPLNRAMAALVGGLERSWTQG